MLSVLTGEPTKVPSPVPISPGPWAHGCAEGLPLQGLLNEPGCCPLPPQPLGHRRCRGELRCQLGHQKHVGLLGAGASAATTLPLSGAEDRPREAQVSLTRQESS